MKSIILAGGVGTRLWPLSREWYPKQFLPLKERSLFQQCYLRASKVSAPGEIFIVTNEIHQYLVRNQIEELNPAAPGPEVLTEPIGKNTLPAICLAMKAIQERFGDCVVAVFPSDHLLDDPAPDEIKAAEPLAEEYLVTFGVKPTKPHTGYGYILPGEEIGCGFKVSRFKEKPDKKTAEEYINAGYLWNSGMFLMKTGIFFEELKKYQPEIYDQFSSPGLDYHSLTPASIDYALLEQSDRVAVVSLDAEWSDLGDFRALYESEAHDERGNAGDAEFLDAYNNFVAVEGKEAGIIGVHDLVIVDTPDALLVCDKDQSERVKELVERLNAKGSHITKYHLQVHRPWGSYTVLENSEFYKIKRVTVKPGRKLSLQMHHHRSEHWIVVSGSAEVDLNGRKLLLGQGESTFVQSGIRHRLGNPGKIPLEVIEVQIGQYLDEDDIIRFDDDFGRAG